MKIKSILISNNIIIYVSIILIGVLFLGFSNERIDEVQDTLKHKFFKPKEIVPKMGYIPKEGFIPNGETAKKIAEAIWLPIYGEEILECKPYIVELKNDIWNVQGTLSSNKQGGVPYIQISKKNGTIIKLYHTK